MARRSKPKTRYPMKQERAYAKRLGQMVSGMEKEVVATFVSQMAPLIRANGERRDGRGWTRNDDLASDLTNLIELLAAKLTGLYSPLYADQEANKFVKSVSSFTLHNINMQLESVHMNPLSDSKPVRDIVALRAKENAAYITNIREKYVTDVSHAVFDGVSKGEGIPTIAKNIQAATGSTQARAYLIANDQTGSLTGDLNAVRQQLAGSYKYVWRTQEDQRVRPSHQALDGAIRSYDASPIPGEEIRCRCVAEPIFPGEEGYDEE